MRFESNRKNGASCWSSKIFDAFTTAIVAVAVLVAILLAGVRLLGITPYAVTSGSMEPAYRVGSVVYVKEVDANDLEVGDAITFEIGGGELATHRIVDISNSNGKRTFKTKGDANDIVDGKPVDEDEVTGKVIYTIPYLGFVSQQLQTGKGRFLGISISIFLVCMVAFQESLKNKQE